jgi:2-keto-4-pentenoate hydratase
MASHAITNSALFAAALQLERADLSGRPAAPISERFPALSVSDAYRIQRLWTQRRVAAGARRVGWKVGLTSQASQRLFGANHPIAGPLLDDMQIPAGGVCDTSRLIRPMLEAEIAFRLATAPDDAEPSRDDALAAVDAVAPAFEIVASRMSERAGGVENAVADMSRASRFVVGDWVPVSRAGDLPATSVRVFLHDSEVAAGEGTRVLGDPLRSVAWLVAELPRHGECVRAGDVILAGSLIAPLAIERGSVLTANFGERLGSVGVRFD